MRRVPTQRGKPGFRRIGSCSKLGAEAANLPGPAEAIRMTPAFPQFCNVRFDSLVRASRSPRVNVLLGVKGVVRTRRAIRQATRCSGVTLSLYGLMQNCAHAAAYWRRGARRSTRWWACLILSPTACARSS